MLEYFLLLTRVSLLSTATIALYICSFTKWDPLSIIKLIVKHCAGITVNINDGTHKVLNNHKGIIVCNHISSWMDAIVLASVLENKNIKYVIADTVLQVPIIGRVCNYIFSPISIDKHSKNNSCKIIDFNFGNNSLLIFPEGTTDGNALPNKYHTTSFRIDQDLLAIAITYNPIKYYTVDNIHSGQISDIFAEIPYIIKQLTTNAICTIDIVGKFRKHSQEQPDEYADRVKQRTIKKLLKLNK